MRFKYKEKCASAKRLAQAEKMRRMFPNRIPVIMEKAPRARLINLNKKKYLIPSLLTVRQCYILIRRNMKLSPKVPLFFFIDGMIPPKKATMGFLYQEHREHDKLFAIPYKYWENTTCNTRLTNLKPGDFDQ
uniref:Uncharacterized protein n=1 Tax=Glossina brevipalpis TaxID=37001 RepID=A0A1A9WER2_9MUSC